jgi:hypothetical protein
MPDQQTGFVLIGGECAYWSRQPFMTLLRVNRAGRLRSGSRAGPTRRSKGPAVCDHHDCSRKVVSCDVGLQGSQQQHSTSEVAESQVQ